jgi:hypothetical protein
VEKEAAHLIVHWKREGVKGLGMRYNLQRSPPVTYFFQVGLTSQSLQNLPRQCHQLETKCLTHEPGRRHYIFITQWNWERLVTGTMEELRRGTT